MIRPLAVALRRLAHVLARSCRRAGLLTALLVVLPAPVALAQSIAVSPTSGDPGTGLTVTGSGWTQGDMIEVDIGGAQVCQLAADGSGNISGDESNGCQVPSGISPGSEPLTAKDTTDGTTSATGSDFTVIPSISVSPALGDAGAGLTVSGSDWTPGDVIQVEIGGAQVCQLTADGSGNISGDESANGCQVPSGLAAGSQTLTAQDTTDGTTTATPSSFTVMSPAVSVSPTAGDPEAALTVSGTGWTPGDVIQVEIGGAQVCQLTADGSGNISGDESNGCQVPSGLAAGSQTLTAQDLADQTAQATGSGFTVTPVASLQPPGSVAVGNPVSLDASGSQGTITKYLWDFGDGNTASTETPTTTHTYSKVGSYIVTLIVVDGSGNTDSTAQTVTVTGSPPTASFSFSPTSPQPAGTQLSFDGSGSTTPNKNATITGYDWNWGDGTPDGSGATPTHSFSGPGTYTVTLTVTDSTGEVSQPLSQTVEVEDIAPVAAFTAPSTAVVGTAVSFTSTSTSPDGKIVSYDWSWGDGTSDESGPTPSHTFSRIDTFPVTLTVTDNSGETSSVTHDIQITGSPPTASFSFSPTSPQPAGTQLSFDGSGSTTPNKNATITGYDWNWGDGTPDGSGATPTHSFSGPGTYTVTLTVTDSTGATSAPVSETVSTAGPLTAAFTPSTATVLAGSNVAFDGTGSTDPGRQITGYAWSFGDGGSATGSQPTHKYMNTGTFKVTLTVTDNGGNSSSVTHPITVIAPPPIQTLILTPVASPTVLRWSRVSATHSGHIDLGERMFCPGPGPGCTASILVTSESLLHRAHAAHVNPRAIVASKAISIKPNGNAEVTFRLSKRARGYLHKHHRLPVRVKITLTRGGQTTTSVLSLVFVSR